MVINTQSPQVDDPLFECKRSDPLLTGQQSLTRIIDLYNVQAITLTGSTFVCVPPVIDTDLDYAMLVADLGSITHEFVNDGWTNCLANWASKQTSDPGKLVDQYTAELADGVQFQAWRKDHINVIVTADQTYYLRTVAATLLARQLNLTDKHARIELFRAIKFGHPYTGPIPGNLK